MKKIIHFDIGSSIGYAHNGCGDVVVVGHVTFTGTRVGRAVLTLRWLAKRFREFDEAGIKFDVVHYETPFARGYDATRSLWGIAGIIEAVAGDRCALLDSSPQAMKSFALGKAPKRVKMTSAEKKAANVAEKLKMIEAAQALGYVGDNEHEADAFIGLKYAERYIA